MKEEISEIKKHSFEIVINSPELCLSLIKCYSKLYKAGCQVKTCKNSLYLYYNQILNNGIQMAELNEESKKRTCIPAFTGRRYISRAGRNFHSETLTDRDAIFLLEKGFLTESDFLKLPDGKLTTPQEDCVIEIAQLLTDGLKVKDIKDKYAHVKTIGEKKCTDKMLTELIKEARELNETIK